MKYNFILFVGLFIILFACKKEDGDIYTEDWKSLSAHTQAPEWFADAKLGIYFHWGVYSVPAHPTTGAWYPFFLYMNDSNDAIGYHTENYGDLADFNYHDFIPMFKGGQFDADNWAQLFKDAGAKFAGLCAQHHDGFALWDSEVNPWNSVEQGPRQDITGKLEKSIKSKGLKYITTFHHARNLQRHNGDTSRWSNFDSHFAYNPNFVTSSTNPDTAKLYGNIPAEQFNQYWYDQLKEVIDQYSPDIIWFDSWLNLIPEEYRKKFAAYYLNEAKKKNQEVVICNKQEDLPRSVGVLDLEQGGMKDLVREVWLTDIPVGIHSWAYRNGQEYRAPELIVRNMIDVWSKNGVVLLNVSPTANGVINQEQRDILHTIGVWMEKHAEAVYSTRPFDFNGFGKAEASEADLGGQSTTVEYTAHDGRFLKSKDGKYLYLFMLGKPEPGTEIEIRGLAKHYFYPENGFGKITVMGSEVEAQWHFAFRNFILTVPDAEMDDIATVFRIELNQ